MEGHALLFFKYFNVENQELVGAFVLLVRRFSLIQDLTAKIKHVMRWNENVDLKLFEVRRKPDAAVDLLNSDK